MKAKKRAYTKRTSSELSEALEEVQVILIRLSLEKQAAYRELARASEWKAYQRKVCKYQYYKKKLEKILNALAREKL